MQSCQLLSRSLAVMPDGIDAAGKRRMQAGVFAVLHLLDYNTLHASRALALHLSNWHIPGGAA